MLPRTCIRDVFQNIIARSELQTKWLKAILEPMSMADAIESRLKIQPAFGSWLQCACHALTTRDAGFEMARPLRTASATSKSSSDRVTKLSGLIGAEHVSHNQNPGR